MIALTALDARWTAVRAGLTRGWVEVRRTPVLNYVLPPVAYAFVLFSMRGKTVPGTDFALGAMALSSILGLIGTNAFTVVAASIATDAEDGTLLRAKATPNGMLGYLVGKIVMSVLTTFAGLLALAIPGIMVAGHLVFDLRAWMLLTLTFATGMVATVPMGVAIGSLLKSSVQAGLMFLVTMVVVLISGIFYPITGLPVWLQWVGQAFPFYWVALGARSALLPAKMAAAEIGGSWRTGEMFTVLGVWAAIGMLLAPILLRRMARRQSGSMVAAARQRVMSKGY